MHKGSLGRIYCYGSDKDLNAGVYCVYICMYILCLYYISPFSPHVYTWIILSIYTFIFLWQIPSGLIKLIY